MGGARGVKGHSWAGEDAQRAKFASPHPLVGERKFCYVRGAPSIAIAANALRPCTPGSGMGEARCEGGPEERGGLRCPPPCVVSPRSLEPSTRTTRAC